MAPRGDPAGAELPVRPHGFVSKFPTHVWLLSPAGSDLRLQHSSSSPVSVEAGRYVAPGVYVGAKQGATGNSSRGVVEIDVLDHTKIEGDIGADSNGRVGVKMQWDY